VNKLVCFNCIEKLLNVLKPISEEPHADAAVALLLKPTNHDFKVLLVKRVESSRDPWSGHIALPGGKRSARDQNLKQTVIRETLEETNIDLLDRCRFLGALETFRSTWRPKINVLPFVILIQYKPKIKLNIRELEGFVWLSLEELLQHRSAVRFGIKEFPAYIVGDTTIWGLTYRILDNFVGILTSVNPRR
jgi:8-oxo-dGTP pyrophosphatase MutT (NUDIX family)